MTALPMDETTLNITGGRFTTIANKAESKYTYYSRNIEIRRSNYGSTRQGELFIRNCVFVPAGGRPTIASLIGGSNSGSMISDIPVICLNGSLSKPYISITPIIRKIPMVTPFLQISIHK